MSSRIYTTSGLILKTKDYKETSKLVTLLSPNRGRISALAKGVNKPKSKMRGIIQPFVHGEFQLYAGKSLHTITQGKVNQYFSFIRKDLDAMYKGAYILEVLEKVSIEEKNESLFSLGVSSLHLLEILKNSNVVLPFFQVNILKNLGFLPYVNECINGHSLGNCMGFDLIEGGTLCEDCLKSKEKYRGDGVLRLQKGSYKALVFLLDATIKDLNKLKLSISQHKELWHLLNLFIETQAGIKLKSKRFLA